MRFWNKKEPKSHLSSSFKISHSFQERVDKRASLKSKYPDEQFSVIVVEGLMDLPFTSKALKPYILMGLQRTMSVMHLVTYIKKVIGVGQSRSLFLEVCGNVIGMSTSMDELSRKYTESDGFVYLGIKAEDIF